jgi:hypothetical protein
MENCPHILGRNGWGPEFSILAVRYNARNLGIPAVVTAELRRVAYAGTIDT